MQNKTFKILALLSLASFTSCSQNKSTDQNETELSSPKIETIKTTPHNYGGWYCPDNLNGFPPVNVADWKSVPVVNGRMATKEETQNGTSLIFVDSEKYPNATTLNLTMPKLASFYNEYSKRDELIIVIQAINVNNDSIVGFRYLNGGNGSARLNNVRFLSDNEIEMIPSSQFISKTIKIEATQDVIWKILTNPEHAKTLQSIFGKKGKLKSGWREKTNVNYHYSNSGESTSLYADLLFGNYYIQNDYSQYNEKFLLLEDEQTKHTELKIVSGPYNNDFEKQVAILNKWIQKVKELSEKEV